MYIGSSPHVTMIAQELTESVWSFVVGASHLLIIIGLILSVIKLCRAIIFVDQELTFKVGHLGEKLVLGLELEVLLVLIGGCLATGTPAAFTCRSHHSCT